MLGAYRGHKKVVDPPRTSVIVINSCEPPCGCWAPNHSLMKEQNMLLTIHPLSALKI